MDKKTLILTGRSNSVGKKIIEEAKWYETKFWVSRSFVDIPWTIGMQIDLKDSLWIALMSEMLEPYIKQNDIHIIHTAGKIKNELPAKWKDILDLLDFQTIDNDNDGIDDEVFKNTYIPLHNLISNMLRLYPNNKIRIGVILSVADFKEPIPATHKSMIKVNRLVRELLGWLLNKYNNISSRIISIWTMATESELKKRINWDKDYWIKPEAVSSALLDDMNDDKLWKQSDRSLFVPHPEYETYFKNETQEQVVERFKYEYWLPWSKNPRSKKNW